MWYQHRPRRGLRRPRRVANYQPNWSYPDLDEVVVDLVALLHHDGFGHAEPSAPPGAADACATATAIPKRGPDGRRIETIDALARLELLSMPQAWTVLATSSIGTESVHGRYEDPIEALVAADRLATDLGGADVSGRDVRDGRGVREEDRWQVRLVPFFDGPAGASHTG